MDFSMYDNLLTNSIIGISLICIILCAISIATLVYVIRKFEKRDIIICTVGLSVAVIGIIIISAIKIPQYSYDIKNNAYIMYNGEYSVVSAGKSDILVYIEKESIRLESNAGLEEGKYIGTIVYTERSKVILDIQFETKIE